LLLILQWGRRGNPAFPPGGGRSSTRRFGPFLSSSETNRPLAPSSCARWRRNLPLLCHLATPSCDSLCFSGLFYTNMLKSMR
jgi:hypothetical protein